MNFFRKLFNSNKTKNEPELIVSESKLESYDVHGNKLSEDEEKKLLKGFNEQKEKRQKQIDELKLSRDESSEWLKNFLERNRTNFENVSYKKISNLYFQKRNNQLQAEKDKDYKQAYVHSEAALSLLEKFIQSQYKENGSFEIKTIPAVEFSIKYNSIMGLVGGFKNIREIANYFLLTKL